MRDSDLDDLLVRLKNHKACDIDVEQGVWIKLAAIGLRRESDNELGRGFAWQLATGGVAIAVSVGFLTAAMAPPVQAKSIEQTMDWVTTSAPIAPSSILGG